MIIERVQGLWVRVRACLACECAVCMRRCKVCACVWQGNSSGQKGEEVCAMKSCGHVGLCVCVRVCVCVRAFVN